MESREENKVTDPTISSSLMLTLVSLLVSGGALWFTWLQYDSLKSQPDSYWYNWIQLAMIALMGIICLGAAVLLLLGKASGRSALKAGLSIIPILLLMNLMVFIFRVIGNIYEGKASVFLERVLAQPHKTLFIVLVVVALTVLGSLLEKTKSSAQKPSEDQRSG